MFYPLRNLFTLVCLPQINLNVFDLEQLRRGLKYLISVTDVIEQAGVLEAEHPSAT